MTAAWVCAQRLSGQSVFRCHLPRLAHIVGDPNGVLNQVDYRRRATAEGVEDAAFEVRPQGMSKLYCLAGFSSSSRCP